MAGRFAAAITVDFIGQRCVSVLALAVTPLLGEILRALQALPHSHTHQMLKAPYLLFNFLPIYGNRALQYMNVQPKNDRQV